MNPNEDPYIVNLGRPLRPKLRIESVIVALAGFAFACGVGTGITVGVVLWREWRRGT